MLKSLSIGLVFGVIAFAQLPVPVIPNSDGATFRASVNANFGYLESNKAKFGACATGQFVVSLTKAGVVCMSVDWSLATGITPAMVGLGNVTNDVQTKASIVPNTVPSAGQVLAGNAGGTAYAPVTISGNCTMTSTGVMTCSGGGGTVLVNGQACTTGSSCTVADDTKVPLSGVNTLNFPGGVSGAVTVKAPDVAGAPVLTWPTATGTIAATIGPLTPGHCGQFDSSGLIADSGNPCNGGPGGPGFTDFTPTKTSGTVVTIAEGKYVYGNNFVNVTAPVTFTLLQPSISSVAVGSLVTTTTIVTSSPVAISTGQALSISLTGTGMACPALNGIFVATLFTSTSFGIPVDMRAGCTGVSGTVGAQGGGVAIVFGNNSGNIEFNHSATMGAMVAASGVNAIANQSSTVTFPNGSVPIAYITIAAGAFSTVTDYRAQLRGMQVQSGAGIDVVQAGGQAQVNVASNVALVDQPILIANAFVAKNATKTLPWRTGMGSPDGRDNCADVGEAYFQTTTPALWACSVPGTPGTWVNVGAGIGSTSNTMTWNGAVMTYNGAVMTWL